MKKCPRCGHHFWWQLSTGQKRCKNCGLTRYFLQTYWRQTRISAYWKGRLLEFFVLGVTAYRLRFQVPVNLKTIQRWFRVLRLAIYVHTLTESQFVSGTVEMDETMFGGRRKGKRGWGAEGKHLVFGIYQRNGRVITFSVSSRSRQTLSPLILSHTKPGSLYYTDDWHAYASLSISGNHVVVGKEKGKPKGRNHINGIEGFWSFAKHWLYQYRGVPKNYFHLYLKEIEWRFNYRNENLVPVLRKLLNQQVSKNILVQL